MKVESQDGVLYTSIPINGIERGSNECLLLVDEMVGKKFFSINPGPYFPHTRSDDLKPEDAGLQGVIAACEDGCYSVSAMLVDSERYHFSSA